MRQAIFSILILLFTCLLWLPIQAQKGKSDPSGGDTLRSSSFRINKIYILGNDKTKANIITRELSFEEGDLIPANRLNDVLERSRNNVYNTNLFSTVELDKLETDSTNIDVLIRVEERWYVWPSVVLRPVDRNLIDWWTNRDKDFSRVRFGPKLDIYNVRGRKESLRFIGLFGFDQRFIFQYSMPYIDKKQQHGLTFGGSWIVNKKMAYETVDHVNYFITDTSEIVEQVNREATSGFIVYKYRPSIYNYHYLTLQGYQMKISEDIVALNPNYFGDSSRQQRAFGLSYSFVRDKRNNRNYPLSGYFGIGTLEKLGLGFFDDVDIWRLFLQYQHFFDFDNGWFLSTSLGGQLSTPDAPYFNYAKFGEEGYLVRGFEQFIIEGPHNLLTKNSIKKRIFKTSFNLGQYMPLKKFRKLPFAMYAKAFSDAGYVKNYSNYNLNTRLSNKALYSIGLGLDLVMLYDITFRLEYAYNSEGQFRFAPNFRAEFSL